MHIDEENLQAPAPATGPEAYTNFIEGERDWCAKHRDEYNKMMDEAPKQAMFILARIILKVNQCSAETSAEKSHFTMGQIREVMSGWDKDLGLIGKFEKAQARIKKWDIEQAAKA
jgi:hypothetical protein